MINKKSLDVIYGCSDLSAFDHDSILFIDCLCTPIPATIATSVMSNKDKQAARAKGKHSYYEQIIQPWIAGT